MLFDYSLMIINGIIVLCFDVHKLYTSLKLISE